MTGKYRQPGNATSRGSVDMVPMIVSPAAIQGRGTRHPQ